MPYGMFLGYNLIGGALWAGGLVGLGFVLGNVIPGVDGYLVPIIAGIIIVSALPSLTVAARELMRSR